MDPNRWQEYSPSRVRALFGLPPEALEELLAQATPELVRRRHHEQQHRPGRKRRVGGGRKRRLTPTQEVLLTLLYLRHNVSHEVVGSLFGVSADTSETTFQEVMPVLAECCPHEREAAQKRWKRGEPSWQPEQEDLLLIDSFETPVRRPSNNQKQRRVYSGKKKRHTLKSQVVTTKEAEIVCVCAGHPGPTSEQRLYKSSGVGVLYPKVKKQGDLGYQGLPDVKVPHKKPPKAELRDEQKEENRLLARVRVRVEHAIRRLKGWRIMREDDRLALAAFPRVAGVVVGLVQLARLVGGESCA